MKNNNNFWQGVLSDMNQLCQDEKIAERYYPKFRSMINDFVFKAIDHPDKIEEFINQHVDEPSYEIGRMLLACYYKCLSVDNPKIHPALHSWMQNCLLRIIQGEKPSEVYGLIRQKGRPKETTTHSSLYISANFYYAIRNGLTYEKAYESVSKKINVGKSTIIRAKKEIPISKNIKLHLLKELATHDYANMSGL